MFTVYILVLLVCAVGLMALIARRMVQIVRRGRPPRSRLLNEWLWTVVPLLVLLALLWRALKVAQ